MIKSAQKYILKYLIFLFCFPWFACMLKQLAAHHSLQACPALNTSEGRWLMAQRDHNLFINSFKFGFHFSFPLFIFVCKSKALRGCLFTFWQNAWMSRLAVWDFEDPVDETWTGGIFGLTDWWKRLSWALSQQSDDGKVMVFVFFKTMPYPWVVAKFVLCSVTQYCLLNKIHFTWFFFFF